MCGIAGILGQLASKSPILQMLGSQSHRGPDNTGFWADDQVIALGHNRLSILDLSDSSNQPFQSEDGRYILVFNGEIYNYLELKEQLRDFYKFRTSSDTEVLLAAFLKWGYSCLSHFNGMFSFAIWDNLERKLFAARDRFGVKPFNYTNWNGSFLFASEISPFWKIGVPKTPNSSVWSSYFSKGTYGQPNETFWDGVEQLPAGHYLIWQDGQQKIFQWYNFFSRVQSQPEVELKDQEEYILELLKSAVSLRFRADVPVGFNLSGGLDSSTLLALVYDLFPDNRKIEAFTFLTGDERYDEIFWVEKMLQDKPFPLNPCMLSTDEVPELARKISDVQNEPFGGLPTLAYAKVFQKAREKGIIVLLDGQGSDEAWAGYDYYLKNSQNLIQGVKSSPLRPEVLDANFSSLASQNQFPKPFEEELLNLQYRDLFYTKIPRALRFNDRVSMAFSTELREPFLDYRLIEYVFSRPKDFKIKDGKQKWLLRKIANKYLGEEISLAPKRPLQTPQREWLSDNLKDWVYDEISSLRQNAWFDYAKIEKELSKFMKGDNDSSFHVWQWLNTALLLHDK